MQNFPLYGPVTNKRVFSEGRRNLANFWLSADHFFFISPYLYKRRFLHLFEISRSGGFTVHHLWKSPTSGFT